MNKYLVSEDIDIIIKPMLDPPTVLSLSEVNTHYCNLLEYLRMQFNMTKGDINTCCFCGFRWIVEWQISKGQDMLKDHFFYTICEGVQLDMAKWFVKLNKNQFDHLQFNKCFSHVLSHYRLPTKCRLQNKYGQFVRNDLRIEMIEWLISYGKKIGISIDIHCGDERAFISACKYGHMNEAKLLVALGEKEYGRINIHINYDVAFRFACENGHIHIAQWLIELGEESYGKIDIHAHGDYAYHSPNEIQSWLYELEARGYGKSNVTAGLGIYDLSKRYAFNY